MGMRPTGWVMGSWSGTNSHLMLSVVRLLLLARASRMMAVCSFSRDSLRHSDSSWVPSRDSRPARLSRAAARTLEKEIS